jgi:hypothetical protein
MTKESILKTRVTPYFSLIIDKEDGTPPVTWKLCYTYKAIAKIEEATGLDLKKFDAWKDISSGKHFPAIVWGGLEKHNPDVTLEQVVEVLNPEAQKLLSDEIFNLMFPGVREAWEKELDKLKGTGETASPNVGTETQAK